MKNFKLLAASIILIFSSCQKTYKDEFAAATPASSSTRPKTYTEDYNTTAGRDSTTFNLSYDGNSRLLSMTSTSNPGDKFIYQYSGNNIVVDIYNSNIIEIHELLYLNSLTFIDSTFGYNSTKDTFTEKYLYNASKQLATLKEYDYSTTGGAILFNTSNYTYDANGNLIKEADKYEVNTYEYTTLINSLSIGFDYLPSTKNLVKTTTNVSGGVTVKLNHTYTFDNKNRLTSEKIVTSGEMLTKSYTY